LKKVANSKGFDTIVWLSNGSLLTEGDHSNLFVVFNTSSGIRELITPLANDLLYNGITRLSILEFAKNWVKTESKFLFLNENF
jgi:branched-subunit amino acid aminotransferase/4-amino-4-deoxychorismate lyase